MKKLTANDPETQVPRPRRGEHRAAQGALPRSLHRGEGGLRGAQAASRRRGGRAGGEVRPQLARQAPRPPARPHALHRHAAPLPGGQRGLGHHPEPHDRGRQPRSPQAPPEDPTPARSSSSTSTRPTTPARTSSIPTTFRTTSRTTSNSPARWTATAARSRSNTEASGRFHTDWLNMMYPRLKLARNLLRRGWGDLLSASMTTRSPTSESVLDEIFGEENFVAVPRLAIGTERTTQAFLRSATSTWSSMHATSECCRQEHSVACQEGRRRRDPGGVRATSQVRQRRTG